ncbi:hypothetical protein FKM82_010824 [Ascaphus truei]
MTTLIFRPLAAVTSRQEPVVFVSPAQLASIAISVQTDILEMLLGQGIVNPQMFGLQTSQGCLPCNCNSFGSKSFDCDDSGQCRCQPGVFANKCDRCAHGFFDFQEGGCTRM